MKSQIIESIAGRRELWASASDQIWEYAELGMKEGRSSALLCRLLRENGFAVESGLAQIDTAFMGSYGTEGPVIAFLGEFDALPRLSQERALPVKKEAAERGNGHGCGHNLLGVGSLAAAVALKEYIEREHIPARVRYYGCPGEENGSGKTFMTRDGCFDGVDAALSWHPADSNCILGMGMLVNLAVTFRFRGRSAHAAATPHLGRSALDAVELMNVGVNFLREHIIPEARVHYAITNAGGSAPNIVQDQAEVYYYIRAPRVVQAKEVYERVCDAARGAALMTGTEVDIQFNQGLSDYIPNRTLGQALQKNLEDLGAPDFDSQDRRLAEEFYRTLTPQDIENALNQARMFVGAEFAGRLREKTLMDCCMPFIHTEKAFFASTDVGDVSQVVPTAQVMTACCALGTPGHSWQFTAQAASSLGHRGMIHAAEVLAATAYDLLQDPELIRRAKEELLARTGGVYHCPIPEDLKPNTN